MVFAVFKLRKKRTLLRGFYFYYQKSFCIGLKSDQKSEKIKDFRLTSVLNGPGAMTFKRIPYLPHSEASDLE